MFLNHLDIGTGSNYTSKLINYCILLTVLMSNFANKIAHATSAINTSYQGYPVLKNITISSAFQLDSK